MFLTGLATGVALVGIPFLLYMRARRRREKLLFELGEKARQANPPPEPTIIKGTGRRHPNGQLYFQLSNGRYGTCRDDGSVYSVPDEMYFEGEP